MNKNKALMNVTEQQRDELALFAKELLESTGVASVGNQLNDCVEALVMGSRDESETLMRSHLLLLIQSAYLRLTERATTEHKSIYGLTGVRFDNDFYGFNEREEI